MRGSATACSRLDLPDPRDAFREDLFADLGGEEGRGRIHTHALMLRGGGDGGIRMEGYVVEPGLVRECHFVERLETDIEMKEGRRVVVEVPEGEVREVPLRDEGDARVGRLVPPADLGREHLVHEARRVPGVDRPGFTAKVESGLEILPGIRRIAGFPRGEKAPLQGP